MLATKTEKLVVSLSKTQTQAQMQEVETEGLRRLNTHLLDIIKANEDRIESSAKGFEETVAQWSNEYNSLLEKYLVALNANANLEKELTCVRTENDALKRLSLESEIAVPRTTIKDKSNMGVFEDKLRALELIYSKKIEFLMKMMKESDDSNRTTIAELSDFIQGSFRQYKDDVGKKVDELCKVEDTKTHVNQTREGFSRADNRVAEPKQGAIDDFDIKLLQTNYHVLKLNQYQLEQDNLLLISLNDELIKSIDVESSFNLSKKKKYLSLEYLRQHRRDLSEAFKSQIAEVNDEYLSILHKNPKRVETKKSSNEEKTLFHLYEEVNSPQQQEDLSKFEFVIAVKNKELELEAQTLKELHRFNDELINTVIQKEKEFIEQKHLVAEKCHEIDQLSELRFQMLSQLEGNRSVIGELLESIRSVFEAMLITNQKVISDNASAVIAAFDPYVRNGQSAKQESTDVLNLLNVIKKFSAAFIELNSQLETKLIRQKNITRLLRSRNDRLVEEIFSYHRSSDEAVAAKTLYRIRKRLLGKTRSRQEQTA